MSMKIYITYLLCFLFIASSCDKKLELAPESTIVDKEVFKTQEGTEQAVSEVYFNFLKSISNSFAYSYADFTTPILNRNAHYESYASGNATPIDYYVVNTWTAYFKTINSANNVISKIPEFAKFDEGKQKQFMAEAKFVRAFCYFNLLCLYGDGALSGKMNEPGLPLQLTPFEGYNTGEIIPRSTNGEVFSQVVTDLSEAAVDLPETHQGDLKTRSRATKGAAFALLSRVYLYMGDYKNSSDAASQVLDRSPAMYSLVTNLRNLFPANPDGTAKSFTSEYILGLPVSQMVSSSTNMDNGLGAFYFKRSYWINPDFINEFEAGDLRVSQLIWKGDSIYNPDMLKEKTTFKFNNPYGRDNVPLIRLGEVMLTRAECLAQLKGINSESISLLNNVRGRSLPLSTDLVSGDFANKEELIQTILKQRKFELAFEGQLRYDMIRTGKPLKSPDIPENRKVLPIPQIEVDISNGLIKQNSGY